MEYDNVFDMMAERMWRFEKYLLFLIILKILSGHLLSITPVEILKKCAAELAKYTMKVYFQK